MYILKDFLNDISTSQTEFQNKNFVIRKNGITIYGKYKNAVRELKNRIDGLTMISFDIMESKVEKKKIYTNNSMSNEEKQLSIKKINYKLNKLLNERKQLKKDILLFYEEAKKYKSIIEQEGFLIDKLEEEYWLAKAIVLTKIDLLTQGRISKPTLEFVVSLPKELKDKFFEELNNTKKLNADKNLIQLFGTTN